MTKRGIGAGTLVLSLSALMLALSGCGTDTEKTVEVSVNSQDNVRPVWLGGIAEKAYDGTTDDLLTAGLGKSGLIAAAPAFSNPTTPTGAELRRNAIYNNYRALVDYTPAGGYGVLYGPNIDTSGADTLGEGKVAGSEYIAYADDGTGKQNVTLMVQVPTSFDKTKACIVSATSSGSRGVYGAIATAGEWGLKHGCAVAYTDKGSGNGVHDLETDMVTLQDGRLDSASRAGADALFRADLTSGELATYRAALPNRVAYKHAHSQQNPEKDWGKSTLRAIEFAFYVLNEKYGTANASTGAKIKALTPSNTLVIASSVSNGGGAALAAAEQDTQGLIDGVAVTEPQVQPASNSGLTIRRGGSAVTQHSKPLADYFTFANIYQPCASLSAGAAGLTMSAAFWPAAYQNSAGLRCDALAQSGLLGSGVSLASTQAEKADAALAKLLGYGWESESSKLHQSHFRFATNSIAVTYINTYGRFSVKDRVCGFSFAGTDASGNVVAQTAAAQAGLFASGNGVPPTSGVNIVYDDSVAGAKLDFLATSPTSATADFALDGALCLRNLVEGKNHVTGVSLTGAMKSWSDRVRAGIAEAQLTANLGKKPTIIVAGRDDTLIPVNHASRAYFGKNQMVEGSNSKARYFEVTNAQHFDTFIAFGSLLGYHEKYIPLHYYFNKAMDAMYAHLKSGTALPPSQVVRTTPRGTGGPAIAAANVPGFASAPAAADTISFAGTTLSIPN